MSDDGRPGAGPRPGGPGALRRARARLRRLRSRTMDLFAMEALASRGEARILWGNRVRILADGREAFAALEDGIRSASSTISCEMYLWRNDRQGRRLASVIAARASSGVRVRILHDAFGCLGEEAVFAPIAEAGGEVRPYRPLGLFPGLLWPGHRNHRKLFILDGRTAFLGSRNVGEEYTEEFSGPSAFRDLTVVIEGAAVHECVRLFTKSWLEHGRAGSERVDWGGALLAEATLVGEPGRAGVQILGTRGLRGRRVMRDTLGALLRFARKEVIFAHAYFFPDHKTFRALRGAARRGVRVVVLLPAHSDLTIAREAGRAFYGRMLRGGIEVRERQGRMLHMKAGIVDGEAVIAGSANLDTLSLLRNEEIAAAVFDPGVAATLAAVLEEDLANSRRIGLEEWERRGRLRRLGERAAAALRAWY